MNDVVQILVVEDSKSSEFLAKRLLSDAFGEAAQVTVCETWMSAIPHIASADCVVIDWLLSGGPNAEECGALDLLKKKGIPHLLWTGMEKEALPELSCPVVRKDSDFTELIDALKDLCGEKI